MAHVTYFGFFLQIERVDLFKFSFLLSALVQSYHLDVIAVIPVGKRILPY